MSKHYICQHMVKKQLDIYNQQMNFESYNLIYEKINLEYIIDLNVKHKTIQHFEENTRENFL